jgi:hypothetical protein
MLSLLVFNRVYRLEIQSVMLEFSTLYWYFNRVYRLEIQSVMLEFSTPLTFSLIHRVLGQPSMIMPAP